jgi:hypothetical protein
MLVLFGAGAAALFARARLARRRIDKNDHS